MKVKYLDYNQAVKLKDEYQHLPGKPFDKGECTLTVTQVLVAPYSPILQWQFLRDIYRGIPPDEALRICQNGRFDVLLLCGQAKKQDGAFLYKDLRSYLKEHDLPAGATAGLSLS